MASSILTNKYYFLQDLIACETVVLSGENTSVTGASPTEEGSNLLVIESKTVVKRPPMFRVIMMNDDYTPMDFVVDILKNIFRMSHEDAISTMLQIHHSGEAHCGTYTRDVAETKVEIALNMAKTHEYPLQCTIEQA